MGEKTGFRHSPSGGSEEHAVAAVEVAADEKRDPGERGE
jgi:hypothetical protein